MNLVHNNYQPSLLLGSVIQKKNAQWEIFKVLSQSKLDKIKNLILINPHEKPNAREFMIDEQIKTIRRNLIAQIDYNERQK